ncbi:hypothetical protein NDU88_004304 [Pleurodeles waltl]|uniref:Uncharacterized protein n=1 Tax=Pleurodeles waltl TaxID=8319 RepID=A0AAV7MG95_PLEWA|nr:hypothetical protein NDU88_004304 [Pleurodeles waltl]
MNPDERTRRETPSSRADGLAHQWAMQLADWRGLPPIATWITRSIMETEPSIQNVRGTSGILAEFSRDRTSEYLGTGRLTRPSEGHESVLDHKERASFFLSFRHSVSQRPSSAVEDARSSAAHSFQRTRSIPHILWAGIPCQLILASRLYFRPGLLAI